MVNGGAGNDTLVWNNGDGSDTLNGDAGNDGTEVNGAPTAGDVFSLEPNAGRVKFQRTNLKAFTLDASTERFAVNGLGGDDSVTANDGVGAFTQLSVDGGAGADTINGSEGADLILGGEGNDVLSGGGGDDRIVGDRGADTMNGGSGDDTLVWNNGDGTDVANGDAGRDDVEVNGAAAAGDMFTVQPNGARIKFDRTNLVPFSIDIGSSETLHANGLGGNDSIVVGEVGPFEVTGAGGAGNDTLTGGGSSETFLGGSGNDTITPGGGPDVVFADDGDDQVNVRDKTADLARGGDGNDSVVADAGQLDILDGFESRRPDAECHAAAGRQPDATGRDHGRRHQGQERHSLDQARCPPGVGQLHRLVGVAHRRAGQAGWGEGRPAARYRALHDRPRRRPDGQGEARQGQQEPRRPPRPDQGSSGRLHRPRGQDRAELPAPHARRGHGHEATLGSLLGTGAASSPPGRGRVEPPQSSLLPGEPATPARPGPLRRAAGWDSRQVRGRADQRQHRQQSEQT